jgi:coenzyme F420-reducing hydrogenase delta subunit
MSRSRRALRCVLSGVGMVSGCRLGRCHAAQGADTTKNCLKKTLAWLEEQHIDVILINPQYGDVLIKGRV